MLSDKQWFDGTNMKKVDIHFVCNSFNGCVLEKLLYQCNRKVRNSYDLSNYFLVSVKHVIRHLERGVNWHNWENYFVLIGYIILVRHYIDRNVFLTNKKHLSLGKWPITITVHAQLLYTTLYTSTLTQLSVQAPLLNVCIYGRYREHKTEIKQYVIPLHEQ